MPHTSHRGSREHPEALWALETLEQEEGLLRSWGARPSECRAGVLSPVHQVLGHHRLAFEFGQIERFFHF